MGSVKKWTLAGVIIGVAAVLLTVLGNPETWAFVSPVKEKKAKTGAQVVSASK